MRLVSKHQPVSNSCNIVTDNVHVVGDNFPFDATFFKNSFPWKTTRFFASHFSGSSSNNYPLTLPMGSIHKYATNPVHFKQHFIRMFFADLFVSAFNHVCLMSTKKTHCSPYPSNIEQMGHGHYPLGGSSIGRWTTIIWLVTIPQCGNEKSDNSG